MAERAQFLTGLGAQSGRAFINAFYGACPVPAFQTPDYCESDGLLVMWGAGSEKGRDALSRHKGPSLCWDMGYWGGFRVAVGGQHINTRHLWERVPGERPHPQELREDYDPDGPILLVGLGNKSRAACGAWESQAFERIQRAYPGRPIRYRPKPQSDTVLPLAPFGGPIEDALKGCSLVVCRHSNVAVDACIAGIPVVCEDGAGAGLYRNEIMRPVRPTEARRRAFLYQLAWWNWNINEVGEAWKWLRKFV